MFEGRSVGWIVRGIVVAPPCPDVSGDGLVNLVDIHSIFTYWGSTSLFGDANGDGTVSFRDVSTVLAHWGSSCP